MKKTLLICSFVALVLMIVWLIVSAICPDSFWSISFQEWVRLFITIVISVGVAFLLTQRISKERAFIDNAIKIIDRLIGSLDKDCFSVYSGDPSWAIRIHSIITSESNMINLLAQYSKKLNADQEIGFIKLKFAEYRNLITEDLEKFKLDEGLQKRALHKAELMISKLNEIKLKQYI